ncbi:MAG: ABC transporter permease [Berryella intestinalis]|uniref:ABC transporter permease n=1 Tax=Berryella intestinalis TaxID=1531429 RepID=UPI002A5836DE|nr:ABC transporter permease [Berryella intestinalis]MDD7369410.1 ABC transporter permease [Berryella intestinalis]MDY3129379.1 ABC transporter permease [Berryella intestinalis]
MTRALPNAARTKLLVFGGLACAAVALAAFSSFLCPYDPNAQDLANALASPGGGHWAGTDRYGRDVLSRVIAGAHASVLAALVLVAISGSLGAVIGVACGWFGGRLDALLMRTSDVFLAFPGLVFALAVAGVLGGGVHNAVIALAVISWPKYARIARGLTLARRNEAYVQAARMSGCTTVQLMVRHLLPNIAGPVLVTAVLDIGTMMVELAGLSFLGLGAQPPAAEWGSMMSDNRSLLQTAPWTVLAPGVAIFVAVSVFNLFADALRDWIDPANRASGYGCQGLLKKNPPDSADSA